MHCGKKGGGGIRVNGEQRVEGEFGGAKVACMRDAG